MLFALCDYIQKEGTVSSRQIARAFHLDEAALLPMLELWERKGRIRKYSQKSCTSICSRCQDGPVYYQFCSQAVS